MIIKTTFNMHIKVHEKIDRISHVTGLSEMEIINLLAKKVMGKSRHHYRLGKSVQYQKQREPEEWSLFHVKIMPDVYEYLLDLRKLLKMSVSLIIADAVNDFFGEMCDKKSSDNYHFKNYFISLAIDGGIICWKLYWGIPHEIRAILPTKD